MFQNQLLKDVPAQDATHPPKRPLSGLSRRIKKHLLHQDGVATGTGHRGHCRHGTGRESGWTPGRPHTLATTDSQSTRLAETERPDLPRSRSPSGATGSPLTVTPEGAHWGAPLLA
ncbi:MAG: hypothetical protein ACREI3_11650, partial [Nitrospirales bacterium]